jgi:hypothetical protein
VLRCRREITAFFCTNARASRDALRRRRREFALGALPANTIIGRYSSIGPNIVIANENHPMSGLTTSGIFYDPACRVVS